MTVTVVLHFSLLDLKLQVLANRGTTTKDGDGRGGDLLDFYSSNPGVSMLQYPASAGNAPGGERARERERGWCCFTVTCKAQAQVARVRSAAQV